MREKFKKLLDFCTVCTKLAQKHIFRSWKDEPGYTHPRLRILPPFFFELLAYLIGFVILYQVGVYLWSII